MGEMRVRVMALVSMLATGTAEVRLARRCLIAHCPERWPLDMFWNSAGTGHDIGRAQGCTAALSGIVRQLKSNAAV